MGRDYGAARIRKAKMGMGKKTQRAWGTALRDINRGQKADVRKLIAGVKTALLVRI